MCNIAVYLKEGEKMTITIFISALLIAISSFAKVKEHRHHEAHVHGGATLNIVFDQLNGRVEFKAASEGILGFEHQAKSEKDKKKLNEMIAKFETDISKYIQFESSLGCIFSKEKIEMQSEEKEHSEHQGEHSDFVASYLVNCKKTVSDSKITFDFTSVKGIRDLDVTILAGDLQKAIEVKKKPVTIQLIKNWPR